MKTLIVYASKTGNTRKLAEHCFTLLQGDTIISPVENAPDPDGFDLVIAAFWVMGGQPEPKSKAFLEKLADANVFLIATHGAGPDSEHAKIVMQSARSSASPANVIGVFSCQGEVSPKVIEAAKQKNPQPVWLHDAQDAVGHPDELDLQNLGITLQVALNSLNG